MYPELQPAPPLSSGVTVDKLITLAGPMYEMKKELHLHTATTQQTLAIIIIIITTSSTTAYQMFFSSTPTP